MHMPLYVAGKVDAEDGHTAESESMHQWSKFLGLLSA